MEPLSLKVAFQARVKEGDHVFLILASGERFQGNVRRMEDDGLVLEVIEAFWRKDSQGKYVPDIAIDEEIVPWDEISRFRIMS